MLNVRLAAGLPADITSFPTIQPYQSGAQDAALEQAGVTPPPARLANVAGSDVTPTALTDSQFARALQPTTPFELAMGRPAQVDPWAGQEDELSWASSFGEMTSAVGRGAAQIGRALWESHKFWEKDISAGQRFWRAANVAALALPLGVGSKAASGLLAKAFPMAQGLILGAKGRVVMTGVAEATVAAGLEAINPEGHSGSVATSALIGGVMGAGLGGLVVRGERAARSKTASALTARLLDPNTQVDALRKDVWSILEPVSEPGVVARATSEAQALAEAIASKVPDLPSTPNLDAIARHTAVQMDNLIEAGFHPVAVKTPDGIDAIMVPGLSADDAAVIAKSWGQRKILTHLGEIDNGTNTLRPALGHAWGTAVDGAHDRVWQMPTKGGVDTGTVHFTNKLSDEVVDHAGRVVDLADYDKLIDDGTMSRFSWGWFKDFDSRPLLNTFYRNTLNGYDGVYALDQAMNPGRRARARWGVGLRVKDRAWSVKDMGMDDILSGDVITTEDGIQKLMQLYQGKPYGWSEVALRWGMRGFMDSAAQVPDMATGQASRAFLDIMADIPPAEQTDFAYLGMLLMQRQFGEKALARRSSVTHGVDFELGPTGKVRADGSTKWAYHDPKTGRIVVDEAGLRGNFDQKPWASPKVKGVNPLPADAFKNPDEWVEFVKAHEALHKARRAAGEVLGETHLEENAINTLALEHVKSVRLHGAYSDPVPVHAAFQRGTAQETLAEISRRIDKITADPAKAERMLTRLKEITRFQQQVKRETLVATGILREDQVEAMAGSYGVYVPSHRARPALPDVRSDLHTQVLEVYDPVKQAMLDGPDDLTKYLPWAETIVHQTVAFSRMAGQQQVYNRLAQHVVEKPEMLSDFLRVVDDPLEQLPDAERARRMLDVDGVRVKPSSYTDDNGNFFVRGIVNGEEVWLSTGRGNAGAALRDGIEMMGPQHVGSITKMLGALAQVQRSGVVLDPTFGAKAVWRDLPYAMIQSGLNPMAAYEGMKALLTHNLDTAGGRRAAELVEMWHASGGSRAALASMDRNAIRNLIQTGIRGKVVKNPLDYASALAELLENSTRVGTFKRRLNKLQAQALAEGSSINPQALIDEAAIASREVSVDFQVRGAHPIMSQLRIITAFYGATLQGADQLRRATLNDPMGVLSRGAVGLTLPSVLLYAYNRRDPEYFKLDEAERNLFWHVKRPAGMLGDDPEDESDDLWLRFPKPFEPGMIFASSMERFLEFADKEDPELIDEFSERLLAQMTSGFMPVPTALSPLMENYANLDSYTNSPIVPQSLEDVEAKYHGGSEFGQMIANLVNAGEEDVSKQLSPREVDNVVRGWTGGLGAQTSELADFVVGAARRVRGEPEPGRTAREFMEYAPITRGFVSPFPANNKPVEDFQAYADQMRATGRTADYLLKSLQTDDYVDYVLDNTMRLGAGPLAEKATNHIAKLRENRALVMNAPLDPQAKRRLLHVIDTNIMEYAEAVNNAFGSLGLRPDPASWTPLTPIKTILSGGDAG